MYVSAVIPEIHCPLYSHNSMTCRTIKLLIHMIHPLLNFDHSLFGYLTTVQPTISLTTVVRQAFYHRVSANILWNSVLPKLIKRIY